MSLTSVSVIMTVFVLNLHHRGPDKRAIPSWLRRLFLGTLRSRGSLFNYRDGHGGYGHGFGSSSREGSLLMRNVSLKVTLENLAHDLREELHLENGGLLEGLNLDPSSTPLQSPPPPPPPLSTPSNVTRRGVDFTNQPHPNPQQQHQQQRQQYQHQQQHQQQQPPPTSTQPQAFPTPESLASHLLQQGLGAGGGAGKPYPHPAGSGRRRTGHSYEEVLLSLLRILERHEREEKEYESVQDWRRLAQTVDRILFFFFLFLTVASTLAVLVIAPSLQE